MAYDLLIKNGRIVDGSGSPAFLGDLGIRGGKIAEIGKLRAQATRTIDAKDLVVAPGFIDNHCHYDAQVTWDPLCSFSCYHGATSVIIGNCSLTLAPVRQGSEERLAEFLSYVEAIPMEVLKTVDVTWETTAEYMDTLDKRLGVNVGVLIGHTAVRFYTMGEESQKRVATPAEIESMCGSVRDGMLAGALGISVSRSKGHYDSSGVTIPACWADENEIFALSNVLTDLGTGVIQCSAGHEAELSNRLMSRLAETTGRQVIYNNLMHHVRKPDSWKKQIELIDESIKAGIRANPMCSPTVLTHQFTMRNAQISKGVPTWHPISLASDEEKLRAYRDPDVRKKLHREVVEWKDEIPGAMIGPGWYNAMWVEKASLPKNEGLQGKSIGEIAREQGKGIIDCLLDLVVEENLDTVFSQAVSGHDKDVMVKILTYPHAYIGLSDGGAHVQFHGGAGYTSRVLGYWVREEKIMSLEQAVRRLTFDPASAFGIYDRGLLRPGLAADIAIFNPETINPLAEDVVYDLPAGAWRKRELARGVHYTIVNGQVIVENGQPTGALPGRILRNSLFMERLAK